MNTNQDMNMSTVDREHPLLSRKLEMNTGTFSAMVEYIPTEQGNCIIHELRYDSFGILPDGVELPRKLPLAEAQAEYRERKASGSWKEVA